MKDSITYVGMDTHKKGHVAAVHFPGQKEIVQGTELKKRGFLRNC